jgi:DNA-directed RNA polymerase subunit RPC12/RpoP
MSKPEGFGSEMQEIEALFTGAVPENDPELVAKVEQLKRALLDPNLCVVCSKEFDLQERLPRVLVQCGHTFCTECLRPFQNERSIKCPLCLTELSRVSGLDKLPVNSQIFSSLFYKDKLDLQLMNSDKDIENEGKFQNNQSRQVAVHSILGVGRVREV